MAFLIGGIGSSHAPSIGHAFDHGHAGRPEWQPLFDAYGPVRKWLRDRRVDTLVIFYNDHLNYFQFSAYPTFALGVAPLMPVTDEGSGPRPFPPVPGSPALAWELASRLVSEEFDITVCQEMELDHGIMSVLPLIDTPPWGMKVIPINVNVLREPLPTPRRCWRLGQAVGSAILASAESCRVAVMATGGLSHQLHGKDFGFVNPEWDNRFMDLLEHQPEVLEHASHEDFMQRGGADSVEMMVWLAMRGALSRHPGTLRRIQRHYWAPLLTGYGLLAFEAMMA